MEKLFRNLERLLEIEDTLPGLEQELTALKEKAADAEARATVAKYEVEALEHPGLITRLLGRVEEKKEMAWTAYRIAAADRDQVRRDLSRKEEHIRTLREEYARLLPARERYSQGVGTFDPKMELHYHCLRGSGAAGRVLRYLEDARSWMQQDAIRKGVSEKNRKLEFLALAAEQAGIVTECVLAIPEAKRPPSWGMTTYFLHPEDYVTSASSEFKQLDLLGLAQRHAKNLRDELKTML